MAVMSLAAGQPGEGKAGGKGWWGVGVGREQNDRNAADEEKPEGVMTTRAMGETQLGARTVLV